MTIMYLTSCVCLFAVDYGSDAIAARRPPHLRNRLVVETVVETVVERTGSRGCPTSKMILSDYLLPAPGKKHQLLQDVKTECF
jgi:hypothetical protein